MHLQHQLPSKVYYLDRLGNMSTSSSCITSVSTSSSHSTASGAIGGSVRKQILPLKPKQPNSYVQHLEMKGKDTNVPVTMLELKKKEKLEKNVVTTLIYRKPSTVSSGSASDHHHSLHQLPMAPRRPGSPSSSGYETDSLVDQENWDVFSNMMGSTFYGHHPEMDMLHSHPIWSPQAVNNNVLSSVNHNHHVYVGGFSDEKYLVQ